VSEHAPCSVLIVRSAEEDAQFRRLLIGFDGSPGAEIALQHSFSLAKQLGSQVHVIWVHETHGRDSIPSQGSVERRFRHILPRINASAAAAGIEVRCVFKTGNPAKAIIAEAEAGRFRVVALGHRGSSGMWGRFLGGVADRVSEQAHCDVLIVREKRPD
jgi:nucleotide-binding universal stress UspA family protein